MMYSVAIPSEVHKTAIEHLIRDDGQEDLCFALWYPSQGKNRSTALIHKVILPSDEERQVHGNVSFMPEYFERALGEALKANSGLAFMHSHPSNGWQGMSRDDVIAERGHAAAVKAATELPFVGLTVGTDEAWSARFWDRTAPRTYERRWCHSVRVVGSEFTPTFHPDMMKTTTFREELTRTISAWGIEAQAKLSNLVVGVVGAGSVGCIVAESLARMGVGHVKLLDFDRVELVNLDRLLFATRADALKRRPKVDVLADALRQSATASDFVVEPRQWSVAEEEGFREALDCDVLFSCVDRPLARSVLNFIAYAHLIPVIDGGISIKVHANTKKLKYADWRAHTVTPTRICMECIGQYDPGHVSHDREGLFDDPGYIVGLPDDHLMKHNENVFAFSASAASFEVLQFLLLVVAPSGLSDPGTQMYHFVTATLNTEWGAQCKTGCVYPGYIAKGDRAGISVTSRHLKAEQMRSIQLIEKRPSVWKRIRTWLSSLKRWK